jgi:hypothetical protein
MRRADGAFEIGGSLFCMMTVIERFSAACRLRVRFADANGGRFWAERRRCFDAASTPRNYRRPER